MKSLKVESNKTIVSLNWNEVEFNNESFPAIAVGDVIVLNGQTVLIKDSEYLKGDLNKHYYELTWTQLTGRY